MPVLLLERIPLPSLRTYTSVSLTLFAIALFYAHRVVTDDTSADQLSEAPSTSPAPSYRSYGLNMFQVLTEEIWCIWILINMAYCSLILLGKLIQYIVFGELRVSEHQHLKDRFWNFVFYKFIFIFGVMNVQTMDEVVGWVAWFTVLGFFHLQTQLSKDRFEYLSFSPATALWIHFKLLSLLFVILLSCTTLLICSGFVAVQAGLTIFAFMAAECLLLGIKILHVLMRYAIHLWDLNMNGIWEKRSQYVYYTELVFELSALIVDFSHHLHMLLYGNIFLSMASLVIFMQLRYLFYEFQRRIKRHKNYIRIVRNMEARFPMATPDDLNNCSDDCAICWEKMESARKLPCGHLFHNSCLRSWLEQDTSCPTCRKMLNDGQEEDPNGNIPQGSGVRENTIQPAAAGNQQTTNHFFHFDGSRYVSWLPSFSVEVTHTQLLPGRQASVQTSQLDSMARQVQTVFPNMSLNSILEDLRITRSVNHTIENILEERLSSPATSISPADASPELQQTFLNPFIEDAQDDVTTDEDLQNIVRQVEVETFEQAESQNSEVPATTPVNVSRSEDFPTVTTGGRFSKSTTERETMLRQRKKEMMEFARRRYLTNHGDQSEILNNAAALQTDDVLGGTNLVERRELAYQAARRRLQQNNT